METICFCGVPEIKSQCSREKHAGSQLSQYYSACLCVMMYCLCLLREIEQNIDVDQNNSYLKSPGFKNDENPRPSPSPHPSPVEASVALNINMCTTLSVKEYSSFPFILFLISINFQVTITFLAI